MSVLKNAINNIRIPTWIVLLQCIAFIILYSAWILPHIVGFRNTAMVVGALVGLYPIYQIRHYFFKKQAAPIWLILGLFCWATFHLLFLSQDPQLQFLEFKRIWKYAAIGSVFALGFGISLATKKSKMALLWPAVYFGLCCPLLIYLIKYSLTTYGVKFDLLIPASLNINNPVFYVPKSDYVAFCLPLLAITLGKIRSILLTPAVNIFRRYSHLCIYFLILMAILFLFYQQNIRNGMGYAIILAIIFTGSPFFGANAKSVVLKKVLIALCLISILGISFYAQSQKNYQWKTVFADAKVALQLDKYQHWKYAGAQGYPNNKFGKPVSPSNYERVAWFKVGVILANQNPLGYGLVEDSFKRMTNNYWPGVGQNLSHSHSGWLDFILAMGL